VALPWLRRFDWPAVAFVPTDFIGRASTFDPDEPLEPLIGWDDLRALEHAGVSVQSHGATHRAWSSLGGEAQEAELGRSRAALETALGTRVDLLAFPYGDAGSDRGAVRARVTAAGYRAAFLYGGGAVALPADPYAVPRIAVGPDTDLRAALEVGEVVA
jgi:peptidoglycan/xylan/chitin deacetylase (PgdA/CDA1 family)